MPLDRRRGASETDIADGLAELTHVLGNLTIPAALLAQWRISNGFSGDNVEFYSTSEIAERNETLEVREFCPGFILFADDGGGRVALLEANENATEVLLNYPGSMRPTSMEPTKLTLLEWIARDCPFSLEPPPRFSAIEVVRLQLDALPPGGLKGLNAVKKLLSLDLPLHELRRIGDQLPYTLCRIPYIQALRFASQINRTASCVSIWRDSEPRVEMPLDDPFE